MKKLALALALVLGAGAAAQAADMPVKAAPMAPAPLMMTWTGFYAGANIGYGWANVGAAGFTDDLNGVIGGAQMGYNWQAGALVFGLEGDIQASGQSRSDTGVVGGTAYTVDQDIPWFATFRGRLGYAAGPWMLYGTGGLALVNYKLGVSAAGGSVSDSDTKAGWTLGGGLEWMFAPRWSAKLEYLYLDTGSTSVTLFGNTFDGRVRDNIVRVGLNYHF